jgi:hypothetical protein
MSIRIKSGKKDRKSSHAPALAAVWTSVAGFFEQKTDQLGLHVVVFDDQNLGGSHIFIGSCSYWEAVTWPTSGSACWLAAWHDQSIGQIAQAVGCQAVGFE